MKKGTLIKKIFYGAIFVSVQIFSMHELGDFSCLPISVFHLILDNLIPYTSLRITNKKFSFIIPDYFIQHCERKNKQCKMHTAIEIGAYQWIKNYIAQENFDIEELCAFDKQGRETLVLAMIHGNQTLVQLLSETLKKNNKPLFASIHDSAKNFFSFMHALYCPDEKYPDEIKKINHYCESSGINERIWLTPLIYAVLHKYYGIAKFLIAHGADVNGTDSMQSTPLHHAVLQYDSKMVALLVKYRANRHLKDSDDRTPFMCISKSLSEMDDASEVCRRITAIINLLNDKKA